MKTSNKILWVALTMSISTIANAASSIPVTVKEAGKNFLGTLYYPNKASGTLPLVVVVHEWWGKTEYPEMRGKKIADDLGYAALVVDLYGEGKTASTPDDAQNLATPFYKDPDAGVKRLTSFVSQAFENAKKEKVSLDPTKLAAIGYCFGGTQALNLARANSLPESEKLLGVVSFHGGLSSSLKAKDSIKPEILVLHGDADKMVSPEDVAAFKDEMKSAKAKLEFHGYPGALHAFTNPKATEIGKKYKMPIAYDEKADKDSWSRMSAFLKRIFGK